MKSAILVSAVLASAAALPSQQIPFTKPESLRHSFESAIDYLDNTVSSFEKAVQEYATSKMQKHPIDTAGCECIDGFAELPLSDSEVA